MSHRNFSLTTVAPFLLGLSFVLVLGIVVVVGRWGNNRMLQQSLIENGQEAMTTSARLLFNPLFKLDASTLDTLIHQFLAQENVVYVAVRDKAGQVIVEASDEEQVSRPSESQALVGQALAQQKIIQHQQQTSLWLYGPIRAGQQAIGTLEVSLVQGPLQSKLQAIQQTMTLILVGVFSGMIMVVFWLVRWATRPLQALTAMAEAIAQGQRETPVPIRGMLETASLGAALERMRTELYRRIETEQQAKNTLQKTVREYVDFADGVREGDLDGQLTLAGNNNDPLSRLGYNINAMVDSLRQRVQSEQESRQYLEQTVDTYLSFVGQVAGGNLSSRLAVNGREDALSHLGRTLNAMVDRQNEMLAEIQTATSQIASASTEILASVSQQVTGASEQSAAIAQTTATMDEVKAVVEQNAHKAQGVAQQAQQTRTISQEGQQALTETLTGMNHIKDRVTDIAQNILNLSERTQQITEITGSISEIAAQSNLLALNASVEAARAGESGKGFSVVAVEMRNLAERSKQAAAQIQAILGEIQNATNSVVMSTEAGTTQVESGVQLTAKTGSTIQALATSIVESAEAAQQIVVSAQQQTTGVEQVATAMQGINQVTIQSLSATQQTEKSAEGLSLVAQRLTTLVDRYQLR